MMLNINRHPPDMLMGILPQPKQLLTQMIRIREDACIFLTQGSDVTVGQSGQFN